jgi:hypothetical protein
MTLKKLPSKQGGYVRFIGGTISAGRLPGKYFMKKKPLFSVPKVFRVGV